MTTEEAEYAIALAKAKRNFPCRLYEAVNSFNRGDVRCLFWSKDGESIFVDVDQFENRVMLDCPGLVAISTFRNFQRQLKVYDFSTAGVNQNGYHEFLHPCFKRGRDDLIVNIQSVVNKGRKIAYPIKRARTPRQRTTIGSITSSPSSQKSLSSDAMGDASLSDLISLHPQTPPFMDSIIHCEFPSQKQSNFLPQQSVNAACQTTISMETFSRLDPRDISVSALMYPTLAGFLENCSTESPPNPGSSVSSVTTKENQVPYPIQQLSQCDMFGNPQHRAPLQPTPIVVVSPRDYGYNDYGAEPKTLFSL